MAGGDRLGRRVDGHLRAIRRRRRRGRRGGAAHCALQLGALELNHRRADLDLIARANLALVDALPVHHRTRLIAEIDQGDVVGAGDLDDRVHTRGEVVVDAKVRSRVLADLHDVLRDAVTAHELIALVESERQSNLGFAFHRRQPFETVLRVVFRNSKLKPETENSRSESRGRRARSSLEPA